MNWIVIGWTAISTIGLLLSLYLVNESRLDIAAVSQEGNGRRKVAFSRFWREGIRATVHATYIVAGLTVLEVLPISRAVVVPILIWGNIGLLINSVVDARIRPTIYDRRETD